MCSWCCNFKDLMAKAQMTQSLGICVGLFVCSWKLKDIQDAYTLCTSYCSVQDMNTVFIVVLSSVLKCKFSLLPVIRYPLSISSPINSPVYTVFFVFIIQGHIWNYYPVMTKIDSKNAYENCKASTFWYQLTFYVIFLSTVYLSW